MPEFGRLDRREAERKLTEGAAALAALGLPLAGFAPPGGAASPGTRAALARLGFAYAASSTGVERLPGGPLLPIATIGAGEACRWVTVRRLALRATLFGLVREALASRAPVTLGELAAALFQ